MKPLEDKDKIELLNKLAAANNLLKQKRKEIDTLQGEVLNAVMQICANQGTTVTKRYVEALSNGVKNLTK